MSSIHRLIDNKVCKLEDVLKDAVNSKKFKDLSIATGYWDLPGMVNIIDGLECFESIRLLIGQEPLSNRYQQALEVGHINVNGQFPDDDFAFDLEHLENSDSKDSLQFREVAKKITSLIERGVLQVKVLRNPRLHAKAYIFGKENSSDAIGIVGSSNFTKAGLTSNAELNYLEIQIPLIVYSRNSSTQPHTHITWFNELWNSDQAEIWTGEFSKIIESSPIGDLMYGPYDVYIKTLMELFPDELLPAQSLSNTTKDILFSFQERNAGIILNKLNKMGVAMLSDSVGLGKTITAGAVIKHYREMGANRIIVIAPAALKQQWRDDLGSHFGLTEQDFAVISLQNLEEQRRLIDDMRKPWVREVDLFVIDEAHNLRSANSTRYSAILELLETSPDAPVLLLTATPINNSLMDFANQIQLALRGSMVSVPVQYRNTNGDLIRKDFFEALALIQAEASKAERKGQSFDWGRYESTIRSGLRHYLVRSTRQGVEEESKLQNGQRAFRFPKTVVRQLSYKFPQESLKTLQDVCHKHQRTVFEGVNPLKLNLEIVADVTQQTMHPLDLYRPVFNGQVMPECLDSITEEQAKNLFLKVESTTIISGIFQIINLLGFVPYRPDIYKHKFYGKTKNDIANLGLKSKEKFKLNSQRSVHNILHITWLKRLESSVSALLKSVEYYQVRLGLFKKYLKKGYVISLSDISIAESEYGEDIEKAFADYQKSYNQIQKAIESGEDISSLKIEGIERVEASSGEYHMDILYEDIRRDEAICKLLINLLRQLEQPENNPKLQSFAAEINKLLQDKKNGQKILVFSFFADTINYLSKTLPALLSNTIPDFEQRSVFLTGLDNQNTEDVACRFSPKAKKYKLKNNEVEIDFLFATDVLSEGQNLQDAGMLINYDLHWNPVRMIQRNGRINRLGSNYENVLIVNMVPHDALEEYLNLVRRLERKIEAIKSSVGTDQSVLGEKENPVEFLDFYSDDVTKASQAAEKIANSSQALDTFNSQDEYIFELRRFLAQHQHDDVIKKIQRIPMGKWNCLPKAKSDKDFLPDNTYLALERAIGKGVITNEPFTSATFIRINGYGKYYATVVDEAEALSIIKTTPDDNKREKEKIPRSLDRNLIARRAQTAARINVQGHTIERDIKESEKRALHAIQEYFKGIDFQSLVRKNIRFEQDNREFRRLTRMINDEIRDTGVITVTTQTRFIKLVKKLQDRTMEERKADRVDPVLFYAK